MDSYTLLQEIHKLKEKDTSFFQFCNIANHMFQFIYDEFVNSRGENIAHGIVGQQLVDRVLNQQSGVDCLQLCRMRPLAFRELVSHLREYYGLIDSRYISAEEKMCFTLFILGHSMGMRLAYIFFGHSIATIHTHFHTTLAKLKQFSTQMIRPHPNYLNGVGVHAPTNPRHGPFWDCIGAIDGTHILAIPPTATVERFRNRHGVHTQNVLAIVDFDMCFTFVSAGWEGSTHDSRMLHAAMVDQSSNFPFPGGNKFYVVDFGFIHRRGFLGPYRGPNARYHMQEFHRASTSQARQSRNHEELFNYVHSSCRNVVERCFGVLKKRFIILQRMPEYEYPTQISIVLATVAVYNFIRKIDSTDPGFVAAESPSYVPHEPDYNEDREREKSLAHQTAHDRHLWDLFRESITNEL